MTLSKSPNLFWPTNKTLNACQSQSILQHSLMKWQFKLNRDSATLALHRHPPSSSVHNDMAITTANIEAAEVT